MSRPRSTSSTRRHPRATAKRTKSELAGPLREVVYIFERDGARGGATWQFVLECGHTAARKRSVGNTWTGMARAMFEPIAKGLAPKRVRCHSCGSGTEKHDPAILIKAFGGEVP